MAVTLIEGFDLVGSGADLIASGFGDADGTVITTGEGAFGGNCFQLDGNTSKYLMKYFAFSNYLAVSFYYYVNNATLANGTIVAITDRETYSGQYYSSDTQVAVNILSSGAINLLGDSGGIKATSAIGVILPLTWHHIELRAYTALAGSAEVYIDGVLVASASGDYLESTSNHILQFATGAPSRFDDIVFQQDTSSYPPLLGRHIIHTLVPNADTAQADWIGSYTDIDDPVGATHDGDVTYISSSTLNAKSTFGLTDLPVIPTIVHAVKCTINARKTDAGTKGVTPYIVSNSVRADGAEFGAAETYGSDSNIHELNPDGSVAWTSASVNALLVGVEITT